jgi:hypothetical protein
VFKQFSRPTAAMVEREAGHITDPLERLRYLRKHAPESIILPESQLNPAPSIKRRARLQILAMVAVLLVGVAGSTYAWHPEWFRPQPPAAAKTLVIPSAGPTPDRIWRVTTSQTEEVYSNGLRIDLSFATPNRPRAPFAVYPLTSDGQQTKFEQTPRGIVFHTTESDLVPFEESENKKIARLGHLLLQYLRREHSYHYLIDRFGRVYRVVEESDAANHAGHSVWADHQGIYVNLNDSFLGIAFEGKTDQRSDITAAQVAAARMLTELLRERYDIGPENCVTHAQVSVNPLNMRIANHMDWARGFPWEAFGLPDNYKVAVPAVTAFGFGHDEGLTAAAGGKDWPGLLAADQAVIKEAAAQSSSEWRYRGMLRHRYQEIVAELKRQEGKRDTTPAPASAAKIIEGEI